MKIHANTIHCFNNSPLLKTYLFLRHFPECCSQRELVSEALARCVSIAPVLQQRHKWSTATSTVSLTKNKAEIVHEKELHNGGEVWPWKYISFCCSYLCWAKSLCSQPATSRFLAVSHPKSAQTWRASPWIVPLDNRSCVSAWWDKIRFHTKKEGTQLLSVTKSCVTLRHNWLPGDLPVHAYRQQCAFGSTGWNQVQLNVSSSAVAQCHFCLNVFHVEDIVFLSNTAIHIHGNLDPVSFYHSFSCGKKKQKTGFSLECHFWQLFRSFPNSGNQVRCGIWQAKVRFFTISFHMVTNGAESFCLFGLFRVDQRSCGSSQIIPKQGKREPLHLWLYIQVASKKTPTGPGAQVRCCYTFLKNRGKYFPLFFHSRHRQTTWSSNGSYKIGESLLIAKGKHTAKSVHSLHISQHRHCTQQNWQSHQIFLLSSPSLFFGKKEHRKSSKMATGKNFNAKRRTYQEWALWMCKCAAWELFASAPPSLLELMHPSYHNHTCDWLQSYERQLE